MAEPDRVPALGAHLGRADSGRVPLARGTNHRDVLCLHGDYHYA